MSFIGAYQSMSIRLLLFFLVFSISTVFGQNISTRGKEFWLGYMENNSSGNTYVVVSAVSATTGTVSVPLAGWSTNFAVAANSTARIAIPTGLAMAFGTETIQDIGVKVTTQDSVNVFAVNYLANSHDASIILPVEALREDYYVMAYRELSQNGDPFTSECMVVATQDQTKVEITPSVQTNDGNPPGVPFYIVLNAGQAYQIQSFEDLVGTRIRSTDCKPIAVFGGSVCTNVGGCVRCDHLYDQMFPITTWGQNYVTVPFANRFNQTVVQPKGDLFRILASQNNTSFTINGGGALTLNAGQYYQTSLPNASYITATKPVLVAQFSKGGRCDSPLPGQPGGVEDDFVYGDPFLLLISPIDQMVSKKVTVFASNEPTISDNFINIVCKTNGTNAVSLDGVNIGSTFTPLASNPTYSFSRRPVAAGNHTIVADSGCLNYVYGFGIRDSYGYSGEAVLNNITIRINAPAQVCKNTPVNFNVVSTGAISNYQWTFGDGSTSTAAAPSHTFTQGGTYAVKLKVKKANAQCDEDSTQWSVFVSAPVAELVSKENLKCFGQNTGKIEVNAAGGAGPYRYRLNNGAFQTANVFNNVAPGIYTVTVVDNLGCNTTIPNVQITQPPQLTATSKIDSISCNGANDGGVRINNPAGGTPPYVFFYGTTVQDSGRFVGLGPSNGPVQAGVRDANGCEVAFTVNLTQPSAIIAAIAAQTNIKCKGEADGSVTLSATGGTPPYRYIWNRPSGDTVQVSPIFNRLPAGTQFFTIRDAKNCSTTISAALTEPANFLSVVVTNKTKTTCTGKKTGTATLQANGGVPPYQYSSDSLNFQNSPLLTELEDGFQNLFVRDANGCVKWVNTEIEAFVVLTGQIIDSQSFLNLVCPGDANGFVTVTGAGGAGPWVYSIDSGATVQPTGYFANLKAGTYEARFIDVNGCFKKIPVVVNQPDSIRPKLFISNIICKGETNGLLRIDSIGGGTPPYQISFNDAPFASDTLFNNLPAGVYPLKIKDQFNCQSVFSIEIIEPDPLALNLVYKQNIVCKGDTNGALSVTPTGGLPPYQISVNGGAFGSATVFDSLLAGNYELLLRDSVGCELKQLFKIEEPALKLIVQKTNKTDVTCNFANNGTIEIIAQGGTPPLKYSLNTGLFQDDNHFSGLLGGWYLPRVQDANECLAVGDSVFIVNPDTISFKLNVFNVTCFNAGDGRVSTTPSGGTPPYEYSMNGQNYFQDSAFANLLPGDYKFYVRDKNKCVSTKLFKITQPPLFQRTFWVVNSTTCYGVADGTASITVTGGRPPYTYVWSHDPDVNWPDATGLAAGPYSVFAVDSSGCKTQVLNFDVPQPPRVIAGNDTTVCMAGLDSMPPFRLGPGFPSGGGWSGPALVDTLQGRVDPQKLPGFGVYKYYYTRKNCRDSLYLTLTGAQIEGANDTVCINQLFWPLPPANPTGGKWSYKDVVDNRTGYVDLERLGLGVHPLTYSTAPGCEDQIVISIVDVPHSAIRTPVGQPDTLYIPDATFAFENATPPGNAVDFEWNLGNDSISKANNPVVLYQYAGVYPVSLTSVNRYGCIDTAIKVVVVKDTTWIVLPTAFSPNNDQLNDVWEVKGFDIVWHKVSFYSRWSGLIYEYESSSNYSSWDGRTRSGGIVPPGAYYFVFEGRKTDGRKLRVVDSVTVVR